MKIDAAGNQHPTVQLVLSNVRRGRLDKRNNMIHWRLLQENEKEIQEARAKQKVT